MERIYPDYDKMIEKDTIITEDEDAGLEYYQHYHGKYSRSVQQVKTESVLCQIVLL